MLRCASPFFALLLLVQGSIAAPTVTDIQAELKAQGFYFGELNGQNSDAYKSALRRFQIRSGLEPTSTADEATLSALGLAGSPEPRTPSAPVPPAAPPAPADVPSQITPAPESTLERRAPVDLRRENPDLSNDRRSVPREDELPPGGNNRRVPPPRPMDAGAAPIENLRGFYQGTPYSNAPAPVQVDTIRRAQSLLASRGYYRSSIDGEPGPATSGALLDFQTDAGLPRTGRLDLETLNAMRLLPGRGRGMPGVQAPPREGGFTPPGTRRTQPGGVWVD